MTILSIKLSYACYFSYFLDVFIASAAIRVAAGARMHPLLLEVYRASPCMASKASGLHEDLKLRSFSSLARAHAFGRPIFTPMGCTTSDSHDMVL